MLHGLCQGETLLNGEETLSRQWKGYFPSASIQNKNARRFLQVKNVKNPNTGGDLLRFLDLEEADIISPANFNAKGSLYSKEFYDAMIAEFGCSPLSIVVFYLLEDAILFYLSQRSEGASSVFLDDRDLLIFPGVKESDGR